MRIKKNKLVKQVIQKKADNSQGDENKKMHVSEAADSKKANDYQGGKDKERQVSEASD